MKRRNQQGVAIIEFVISATVLFILLFAIIEFSIILYDKAVITNASREGARAGIVFNGQNRLSSDDIQRVINNYVGNNLISLGSQSPPSVTVAVSWQNQDGNDIGVNSVGSGDQLTVTVSYPYRFLILPNFVENLGLGLTLTATTKMREE
jgi:Flp pilus assembly protein TadG